MVDCVAALLLTWGVDGKDVVSELVNVVGFVCLGASKPAAT